MTISLLKLAPFEDADAHRRAQLTGSSPTRILLSATLARLTKIGESDGRAFASRLDDAAVVHRDERTNQVAAEGPNSRKRAVFVGPCKPAIAGDVGRQQHRELAGLAHGAPRQPEEWHKNRQPNFGLIPGIEKVNTD
jgi:hypothetical protein